MEKLLRKSAVKNSPMPLLNFDKKTKIAHACKRLLEISYLTSLFKLENMFTKLFFWSGPLNLEIVKKRKKNSNTLNISQERKKLFRKS